MEKPEVIPLEKKIYREKLKQLATCEQIVSDETINAIGRVTEVVRAADDNAPSSDELDEELEEQYKDINLYLDLPNDTYSLTEIRPELPSCVRYGVRAGMTHINMPKFSPLSRGHQVNQILEDDRQSDRALIYLFFFSKIQNQARKNLGQIYKFLYFYIRMRIVCNLNTIETHIRKTQVISSLRYL